MSETNASASNVAPVNSVLHATRILELFSTQQRESMALTEISRTSGCTRLPSIEFCVRSSLSAGLSNQL
jgi:hypothetical protein